MKNLSLTITLTLALAFAVINAAAETETKADPDVEKPCIEPALAEQLESQLDPLMLNTDQLLLALVDDKQTATAAASMYVLGRTMMLIERSRRRESTSEAICPVQIDRLSRDTSMLVRTYAALLDGNDEIDISALTNKAAREALPQLLAQAKTLEKTVELIRSESQR